MGYLRIRRKNGQAVAEMALFGSLILLIFGALLSYLQRANDQQYVQMEAFRRALEKADTHIVGALNPGASVQYTAIENRRHSDIASGFRKGSPRTLSASASVFWSVPYVGTESERLIAYKVNENEQAFNYRSFVDRAHDSIDEDGDPRQRYWVFEPGELTANSQVNFDEEELRQEDTAGIANTKHSTLRENIHTHIPYKIIEVDKDNAAYERVVVDNKTLLDLEQNLYRDRQDGQYKYSTAASGQGVTRGEKWETKF